MKLVSIPNIKIPKFFSLDTFPVINEVSNVLTRILYNGK